MIGQEAPERTERRSHPEAKELARQARRAEFLYQMEIDRRSERLDEETLAHDAWLAAECAHWRYIIGAEE